ncbi:UDP-N-acetylglucosamine 1-carboxyvinyltransferase [Limisalsivibrio acetivorans]|uniref:UDP-N-acetylglucosamine 1-carboxyvinyltransferase n=1 Tax=Limisalsivibrio acetivorans TaxID=1304888 RepID=UPI0003B6EEC1|nr:UDP-N-acetylglucosamine 1-carboxyvinyltransferase [Limisalsivibrio acetivorans]
MEKLVIEGGRPLNGKIRVSGAKNACLPILAASILAEGKYTISNIPSLVDIRTMLSLLGEVGVETDRDGEVVQLNTVADNDAFTAPYELVKTMRASVLTLGPLLAKKGRAKVSLPGGCAIGERPVDQHLKALRLMGADIEVEHGYIDASCSRLKGAEITFDMVTVTGTENIMMAAALAEGKTVLYNAAQEPEVVDLAKFLKKMGAVISGEGSRTIVIEGVDRLESADYNVMADRIEAGTYLCAAAGAGGHLILENAPVYAMKAILDKLGETGLELKILDDSTIDIRSEKRLLGIDATTHPYPGFPTDMQAQFMAVMVKSRGISVITETIFENRFMHVSELKRMGADIRLMDKSAVIKGVKKLSAAPVMASDLRASASLVIAGLMAEGTTEVHRVYHLDRGYEKFDIKLAAAGAKIERVKE